MTISLRPSFIFSVLILLCYGGASVCVLSCDFSVWVHWSLLAFLFYHWNIALNRYLFFSHTHSVLKFSFSDHEAKIFFADGLVLDAILERHYFVGNVAVLHFKNIENNKAQAIWVFSDQLNAMVRRELFSKLWLKTI